MNNRKFFKTFASIRSKIQGITLKQTLHQDLLLIEQQLHQIQTKRKEISKNRSKNKKQIIASNEQQTKRTYLNNENSDISGLRLRLDFQNISQKNHQKKLQKKQNYQIKQMQFRKNKQNKLVTASSALNFHNKGSLIHRKKQSSIMLGESLKLTNKLYKNYKDIYGQDAAKMQLVDNLFSQLKTLIQN